MNLESAGFTSSGARLMILHSSPMPNRILVVRFGALGDLVLLTVLFRALRRRFPDATIDLATKGRYSSLLRSHPTITTVHGLPPGGSLREFGHMLRGNSYDIHLDAHSSIRSRTLHSIVGGTWQSLKKPRIARMVATWTTARAPVPHLVDQYLALASSWEVTPDDQPADLYADDPDIVTAGKLVNGEYVVLAPGAQHNTKRWPAYRWRELATLIRERGTSVVGLGLGNEEQMLPDDFATSAFGHPIGVSVAVCQRAKVVVANDSGLMHLATAVRTPVVVIYGPTAPDLGYAPYRANARFVTPSMSCRPCSVFGGPHCPAGHHQCMTTSSASDVFETLQELL